MEGSSNNKALEIVNLSGSIVDLSRLQIRLFAVGATGAPPTTPTATLTLSGTLAPGAVVSYCNPSAAAGLKAQCSTVLGTPSVTNFNGNDALLLVEQATNTILDRIGDTTNPGSAGWTANGLSTTDRTIRRKCSVTSGDPNFSSPFVVSAQWDGFPVDTFTNVGVYSCPVGVAGPGTTDADCGLWHQACGAGTHCLNQAAVQNVGSYYACGCTPEQAAPYVADSCSATNDVVGGNGLTVCDPATLACREPRDYDQATRHPAPDAGNCWPGFLPIPFGYSDGGQAYYPDGGTQVLCLEDCAQGEACTSNETSCNATYGLCLQKLCGPGYDTATYYGGCNLNGVGDGTCYPFPDGNGGNYGLCVRNGSVPKGGACSGYGSIADPATDCVAGSYCFSTGLLPGGGYPSGACYPVCNANNPGSTCAGPTTCAAFNGATTVNGVRAGYCSPTADGGATVDGCGLGLDVCHVGESCGVYGGGGTGVPAYNACGCTDASCAANDGPGGSGLTVCDSNTFQCRAPRDYEAVFTYAPTVAALCAPGFEAVNFGLPDGGPNYGCLESCGGNTCSSTITRCDPTALTTVAPDGGTYQHGACVFNDCGPGTAAGGSYYGTCHVVGAGDGVCQPFVDGSGQVFGVCLRQGTAASGADCTGTWGQVDSAANCSGTDVCFSYGLPPGPSVPTGSCFGSCNANAPGQGPNQQCGAGVSCHALGSTTNPEDPGICY